MEYLYNIFTGTDRINIIISTIIILLYVLVIRFGTEKFNAKHLGKKVEKEYREMTKYSWKMRTYFVVAFFGTMVTFMSNDRITWFNSVALVVISVFEFADNKNLYNEAKRLYEKKMNS